MLEPTRTIHDLGLSDAKVTELLDNLDAGEIDTRESERRSLRRYLRGTALLVRMSHPGFTMVDYRVRLRNISQHGVAFLSRHEWKPGTQICLQLPIGPDLGIVEQRAVVVRSRHIEGQIYEVGAEFAGN